MASIDEGGQPVAPCCKWHRQPLGVAYSKSGREKGGATADRIRNKKQSSGLGKGQKAEQEGKRIGVALEMGIGLNLWHTCQKIYPLLIQAYPKIGVRSIKKLLSVFEPS